MKRHDGFVPRKSVMGKPKNVDPKQGLYDAMHSAINSPVTENNFYHKKAKPMEPEKQSSFLLTIGWAILVVFALLILLNVI